MTHKIDINDSWQFRIFLSLLPQQVIGVNTHICGSFNNGATPTFAQTELTADVVIGCGPGIYLDYTPCYILPSCA